MAEPGENKTAQLELASLVEVANSAGDEYGANRKRNRWRVRIVVWTCSIAVVILLTTAAVVFYKYGEKGVHESPELSAFYKASRTGYHFQPADNWMNDPNGPMFYGGYYHLFYQYNPSAAVWGNISWGHAVSTDLINWIYLELALSPDQTYDMGGVWSGSSTIRKDGTPAIIYTGSRISNESKSRTDFFQSQCMALPVDPTDPLLRKWAKAENNPIIMDPPAGHRPESFRDPATAWVEDDGLWRLTVGTKLDNADGTQDGMSLLYKSSDFMHWELDENTYLHSVAGTGMWECVDFFPVTVQPTSELKNGQSGCLDSTENVGNYTFGLEHHAALKAGNYLDSYKYVMKASLDLRVQDYYAVGTYSTVTHKFTVDDLALDLGKGHQYDYGRFYASKSFYDSSTGRRILWSWVREADTRQDDIIKGWASVQAVPRTIWLDNMTNSSLLTWPVEEVEALRGNMSSYQNITLNDGDVIEIGGGNGSQLDIMISFEKPDVHASVGGNASSSMEHFDCNQGGSAQRGIFGPFGVLVHADEQLVEQTAVFFYLSLMGDGQWATYVCSDQSRSSLDQDLDKTVYGSSVTVLPSESELQMRILLDHSIVETFAQGGRVAITSRVYPTVAINGSSHLFLFNNGTTAVQVTNLDVYQMTNVHMVSII